MNASRKLARKAIDASRVLSSLRLVWRAAPAWTIAQISLLGIAGVLPLITLYLSKLIIDTLSANLGEQPFTSGDIWQRLVMLLVGLGGALLVNNALGVVSAFVSTMQSQKFSDYMYGILHAKSIALDLEYYENPEYHDTLQRAQKEATYRPNQLLRNLINVFQNAISLVVMGGVLLTLHWGLAAVVLMATVPALWVRMLYADERYRWQRRRTSLERRAGYFNWLMIQDTFAKEVRLFGFGQILSRRFDQLRRQLYRELLSINRRFLWSRLAVQTGSTVLTLLAYGYVVYSTFNGRLTIGDLVLYYEALQRGQQAFRSLTNNLSALYEDKLFLDNLYEFLTLTPKLLSPAQPQPIPSPIQQGFRFKGVDFQYGSTDRQALHGIDLQIGPGEVIALVGENGSGKTTLIKLLCRLYDPSAGCITLDGIDLRELDVTELRQQVSVIFQDYVKYAMTARDNIWLGNVDFSPDDDRITAAAVKSGADSVIQSLPQQYDTMLGKLFKDGEELSIGQWQKIALARAFLRNAQLVVLDEPTSAMDPQAEYEVFQGFREIMQGRSAILISHRLSTVRMADRIYLMDQGKIVEVGTHEALMAKQGHYAQLFEIQAQNYR